MVGLELRDTDVVAVVDRRWRPRCGARHAAQGGDVAAAAVIALDAVSARRARRSACRPWPPCFPSRLPRLPPMQALRAHLGPYFQQDRPIALRDGGGSLGEAWTGAAIGKTSVVLFAIADHAIAGILKGRRAGGRRARPRTGRRLARAQPRRARGLPEDRLPRSRSRGGRHRPPHDLADQAGDRSRSRTRTGPTSPRVSSTTCLKAARGGGWRLPSP